MRAASGTRAILPAAGTRAPAAVGGNASLRGYSFNRFTGDASAFGGAELHLPLFRMTLLTRGDVGVIGFSDVGRVWYKGASEGGWHTGNGGGLWFGTMGQALTVTYAKGEEGRVYFTLGYPF